MKGHFVTMVSVWCGLCVEWVELDEVKKRKCAKQAKQAGWRLTRKHGWLCPRCAKEDNPTHAAQQEPPHDD